MADTPYSLLIVRIEERSRVVTEREKPLVEQAAGTT